MIGKSEFGLFLKFLGIGEVVLSSVLFIRILQFYFDAA